MKGSFYVQDVNMLDNDTEWKIQAKENPIYIIKLFIQINTNAEIQTFSLIPIRLPVFLRLIYRPCYKSILVDYHYYYNKNYNIIIFVQK